MNNVQELLASPLWEKLSLTLLHSIWQSAVLCLLAYGIVRSMPRLTANLKYTVFVILFLMQIPVSLATMLLLSSSKPDTSTSFVDWSMAINATGAASFTSAPQFPWIILIWATGVLIFTMRFFAGLAYVHQLQLRAVYTHIPKHAIIHQLLESFRMQAVRVGESLQVSAPIVIGVVKPVILFPAGMLSGLSEEQLECILIHELAHIRRRDYLVNIIQTLIESLLFFNPFVWLMSAEIRKQREYCCDDEVIAMHKSPHTYAHTLAFMEEFRMNNPAMAVGFAGTKNQLLNRIKRVMEKSVRENTGARVIPALIIVIALACISWVGVKSAKQNNDNTMASDTGKQKTKNASYYRQRTTTVNENGAQSEDVVENFEGDEEFRGLLISPPDHIDIPPFPDLPQVSQVPGFPTSPDMHLSIDMDTIPDVKWESFSRDLEAKIQEAIARQESLIAKMHDDLGRQLSEEARQKIEAQLEATRQQLEEVQKQIEAQLQDAERAQQHHIHALEQNMETLHKQHEAHAREMEKHARAMEEKAEAFNKEVTEQLIKDGYLKKGEKVKSLSVDEDGTVKVNGKTVSESDQKKYHDLHKKYFGAGHFRYVE